MADLNNNSGRRGNGRGSSSGPNLRNGHRISRVDYLRKGIINMWSFDYTQNKGKDDAVTQAQFAYYHWTEKLKESWQREDRKKSEINDHWTAIYQIFGFYIAFQGVIFGGITAMTSYLSCEFYKIPLVLSVLSSAATFVGVYVKFTCVLALNRRLNKVIKHSKNIQDRLNACEEYSDVRDFDIDQIEKIINNQEANGAYEDSYNKEFNQAWYLKWAVLTFLVAFSAIFAHLDFVVMCRGYH